AARGFLQVQGASHWRHALAGTLNDEALFVEGTQTAVWIVTTCVRAADTCFALAGGSALYETSPLQRRLRGLHVAAQHATVQQRHYANAGKLLLKPLTGSEARDRRGCRALTLAAHNPEQSRSMTSIDIQGHPKCWT